MPAAMPAAILANMTSVPSVPVVLALLVMGALCGGGLVALYPSFRSKFCRRNQEPDEVPLGVLHEHTPIALLLYADAGMIRFANRRAEELLFDGEKLQGENLLKLLDAAPAVVREAMLAEGDSLFSLYDGEEQSFQMLRQNLILDGQPHVLLSVNPLTRELSRREVAALKKVIRVISHELNNSLATMSSLLESARLIVETPDQAGRLPRVLSGLEGRAEHLKNFLGQYAALARLPQPRVAELSWRPFLDRMRQMFPEARFSPPPSTTVWFDETQIEQLLINLMKNANEAGGDAGDVELLIREVDDELHLGVLDRGHGFSDEALEQGLLPFYSTKQGGSGLGLALCREIAEGHGGTLRIKRRAGGGSAVYCVLPLRHDSGRPVVRGTLSLTRA